MVVWGVVALVVQLATYFVVSRILRNIADEIRADRIGKGLFLGAVSIIVGILNAACMSY
jgi:putative membrane protein